jgi:hypothetical protein
MSNIYKPQIPMISLKDCIEKTIVAIAVLSGHQEVHIRFSDSTILSLTAVQDYDEGPTIEWSKSEDTQDYTVLYALDFITEEEQVILQQEENKAMEKQREASDRKLYQRLKKRFDPDK